MKDFVVIGSDEEAGIGADDQGDVVAPANGANNGASNGVETSSSSKKSRSRHKRGKANFKTDISGTAPTRPVTGTGPESSKKE